MDESGGHYSKWNKPDRGRQILYGITYIWTLKRKKKANFTETENRMVGGSWDLGGREVGKKQDDVGQGS